MALYVLREVVLPRCINRSDKMLIDSRKVKERGKQRHVRYLLLPMIG